MFFLVHGDFHSSVELDGAMGTFTLQTALAGFFKVLGQLTETGVVSPEQFIKTFEHMKRSGDYYVTVIEDTNLGQIVATATLVIEHKFTHSCAKEKEQRSLSRSPAQRAFDPVRLGSAGADG
ncbi:glucosamine 6-phosphate n-acetyltransferase [Limosa lapponica baueri]|uniref:Glucosamine 6-phosphate N-acetyltransferase n=1 Tax=Limosa lapponica baueri TaxID=1758121 RepID=A0A2I0T046_LIMLA|nr:glucosamine 6-phosphate n-acetyltransferase [Limosa lapponica baueri]